MRREQAAGVQVRQQLLHREQRVDLVGVEPQAGQFVLRAGKLRSSVEPPAVALAVEYQRGIHAVAQVRQVALQRGGRDTQLNQQRCLVQAVASVELALQAVKPFGLAHG